VITEQWRHTRGVCCDDLDTLNLHLTPHNRIRAIRAKEIPGPATSEKEKEKKLPAHLLSHVNPNPQM